MVYGMEKRTPLNCFLSSLFSRTSGTEGSITINGHERNLSQFRKLSCYIMQDNQLHANLTVEEAMNVATALKLGKDLTKAARKDVVRTLFYRSDTNHAQRCFLSGPWGTFESSVLLALAMYNRIRR
jgi:ABC-type multidrug transport system, ATPase component